MNLVIFRIIDIYLSSFIFSKGKEANNKKRFIDARIFKETFGYTKPGWIINILYWNNIAIIKNITIFENVVKYSFFKLIYLELIIQPITAIGINSISVPIFLPKKSL